MITDLPIELSEELLSRLPLTSLRRVRSTCKKLNALTKDRTFTKKHLCVLASPSSSLSSKKKNKKKQRQKEFHVVMLLDYKLSLMRVNLSSHPSVDCIGKLVDDSRVDISKVFHCDGLLLCVSKDMSCLVVWNPYLGQTKWIKPLKSYHSLDKYALGYSDNKACSSSSSHKIIKVLRFVDDIEFNERVRACEMFDLRSNTWNVIDDDVNFSFNVNPNRPGLSLEGNTYWFAQEKVTKDNPKRVYDISDFLMSFDFATERFGPRMPLPFHAVYGDTVAFSSVGEKQLAVLFQRNGDLAYTVKIWISSMIETNGVTWNKELFLAVDMKPLTGFRFTTGSFFVDEKKKVVVVLDKNRDEVSYPTRNIAFVIGEKAYLRRLDVGESRDRCCYPLMCSYVPSTMQIKQPGPQGDQNTHPS